MVSPIFGFIPRIDVVHFEQRIFEVHQGFMKATIRSLMPILPLFALLLVVNKAYCVEVKSLYEIALQVEDRTSKARKRAIQEGFGKMLVKVSGASSLISEPHVIAEQAKAERYVVQYGYESRQIPSLDDLDKKVDAVFLKVKFDPLAINQFLRRNGNPIWASNRPKLVVWAAHNDGRTRQLLGGAALEPLQAVFSDQAQERGLPIQFPTYDEVDSSQVRAGDFWGMFIDPIVSASSRYQANVVLVAKLREAPLDAQVSAMLVIEGQQHWFDQKGDTLDTAIRQVMNQVVDKVGEHFGVLVSDEVGQQVILDVESVTALGSYAELNHYLESVLAVRRSQLQRMQGNNVRFLLTLESSVDALEQSFRLDKKLVPLEDQPLMETPPAVQVPEPQASLSQTSPLPQTEQPEAQPLDASQLQLPVIRYRWVEPVSSQ